MILFVKIYYNCIVKIIGSFSHFNK